MNILLDETKLKLLLSEKREEIGRKYDVLGISLPIVTYIFSLLCSDFHDTILLRASTIRWIAYFLAVVYIIDLLIRFAMSIRKKYNHEMLYEDIKNMNQIKHYFSLVAIKDEYHEFSNRYLLYYDKVWKCWFFPNYKTKDDNNEAFVATKLSNALHIKEQNITLTYITEKVQPKFSRRDQVQKVYSHRLYQGKISDYPKEIQSDTFTLDQIQYRWMTIAEMEEDDVIREVNSDVVSLVKESIQ